MYIFTRLSTNERRSGAPSLPLRSRGSSSEFSTALAGGRGAASASTASRSQAPRGESSAPPIWWRCSSACPTQARAAQRRLLGTVAALRRVSWFGRALAACERGIETTARARRVGRSSRRVNNGCRLGRARPKPAVIIPSTAFFCLRGARQSARNLRCSGAPLNELVKASFMF